MLQLEILAIYGLFVGINLTLFLAICISHKRTSLNRIKNLKEEWFFDLPLRFMELAEKITDDMTSESEAYKELKTIISSYDKLEELELAYSSKTTENLLSMLSLNFLFLIISGIFVSAATIITDDLSLVILFAGGGGAFLVYYFVYLYKVVNFLRTEEDNFQKIQNDISSSTNWELLREEEVDVEEDFD